LTSVNSSYNDGPLNSNKSGDIIFLTNNAFSPKNKLGIFYSIKTMDNKWSTPKSSPMNSPNFNVTHPFYDENSKILYFASDKNGNYDLYQVNFDKENWINPKEISIVNSSSDDCFPFLIEDQLFFTSNREGGLGGLDLYQLDSNKISNLGEPFNSAFDDLAISWINDSTGYFSSNRNSNGQNDDVFKINVKTIPEPILVVDNKIEEKKEVESVKFKPEKNINFAFDSYAIQEDHKIYLLEIATEMKKDSTLYLIVSGHTDNVGDKSYNLELSKKRANAVKKYLIKNGVNSNRIIAEGYGFSKPIESNNTAEGRALNRRVDFKILEERQ
jgi:outer membrane protein OmpA-like peptidoglycan-associated protein